jgi:hypothetical protein
MALLSKKEGHVVGHMYGGFPWRHGHGVLKASVCFQLSPQAERYDTESLVFIPLTVATLVTEGGHFPIPSYAAAF